MAFVNASNARLEYRTIPAAASTMPSLVFLHEGLGSVSLWRDFPDKLCRQIGAPGLVYSRRGYGKSSALAGPRAADFMHKEALEVLPEVLSSLGINRPVLVGHSDGASIALIYATHAPENVAGLVLMAPHVMVEPVSISSISKISKTYHTSDLRTRLARYHDHVDDAFLGWSDIWLSPEFLHWTLLDECQRLKSPALLIQGENDEYGTLAQLDAIEAAAGNAGIQRLVLSRCGHSPWRDQETLVLDAIAGFVSKLACSHDT